MKIPLFLLTTLLIFTGFVMPNNRQEHYYPSKGEQLINSILAKAAKIIKDKYNIRPSGVGVAMPGGPIQEVTLCFDTSYLYTKEQLRELLIKTSQELLDQINKNSNVQEFLKEKPFTIKNIQIIIYNQDKQGNDVYDPEILTAEISRNVLTYRTIESSTQFKLKNQFEESYEEALKLIK